MAIDASLHARSAHEEHVAEHLRDVLEAWLTASVVYLGAMYVARFLPATRAQGALLGLASVSVQEEPIPVPVPVMA